MWPVMLQYRFCKQVSAIWLLTLILTSGVVVPGKLIGVQPVWLQPSRDRKSLISREKARARTVEPRPMALSGAIIAATP